MCIVIAVASFRFSNNKSLSLQVEHIFQQHRTLNEFLMKDWAEVIIIIHSEQKNFTSVNSHSIFLLIPIRDHNSEHILHWTAQQKAEQILHGWYVFNKNFLFI